MVWVSISVWKEFWVGFIGKLKLKLIQRSLCFNLFYFVKQVTYPFKKTGAEYAPRRSKYKNGGGTRMMDMQIQIQSIADEVKETRMWIERLEHRIQMLTDSFVVSGLWRTTSQLDGWKSNKEEADMLQFEMSND